MPLTVGSNISSLKAQRMLAEGSHQLNKTYERLSSGLRINKAADDAAGLAISESLKSDRKVFNQGIRNLNDGISLITIADAAIENLTTITVRLKELAEQAANGAYGVAQRTALDQEAQSLASEYLRIAQSTKFNGRNLFSGSFGDLRLQGGFGTDGSILSNLGGAIGDGTLGSRTQYNVLDSAQQTEAVRIGDLNGDGYQDLVAGVDYGSDGNIIIMLGNAAGTFSVTASYAKSGSALNDIELGDLNNDGILDIVTHEANALHIRLGNGDGTFSSQTTLSNATPNGIVLGDLNKDGNLDIISNSSTNAYVRLGTGTGSFGAVTTYAMEGTASRGVELGDLNNDGILDMLTSGISGGVGAVTFRLGNGDGTFGASSSYTMDTNSYDIKVGDLNGDGKDDLAVAGASGVVVRLGNGDGTFGATATYNMGGLIQEMQLGDLNGDGHLDILTPGVRYRLGNGDGTFGAMISYTMEPTTATATFGDVNGDGVLDVISGGYDSGVTEATVSIRLGNTTTGIGALLSFNLTTIADARQALSEFTRNLNRLNTQRGVIGSFQSRLNVAINVLAASSENYAAAESRITNADIAEESSKLVRQQILQNAASAILAQANQQPSLALQLLSTD